MTLDGLLSELILPTDNVEAPFHWYQLVRFANLRSPGFRGSVRSLAEFVHRLTVSRSLQKFSIELSSSFAIAELRASKSFDSITINVINYSAIFLCGHC